MLTKHKPDYVIAFHDDFKNSVGTKDMLKAAKDAGIPSSLISHKNYKVPSILLP